MDLRPIPSSSRSDGAEHAVVLRECQQIAAEARRLLYKTRAHVVRSLPGVEAERSRLVALLESAEALARELRARRSPARPALLAGPAAPPGPQPPAGGR
jgi:hypothetical protein